MSEARERERAIRRVLWVTLFLNLAVAVSKLAYGHLTSTLGLVADGYHSLLDGSSNVVGLVGVTLGAADPDEDHPYGHRKFEVLSAMAISMFIFHGAWVVLSEGWERLFPAAGAVAELPRIDRWSFVIALATLGVNAFVARYERRRGEELGSPLLMADAAHTSSDVIVTSGLLVGMALALHVNPLADVGVALLLGLFLIRTGYHVLLSSLHVIADHVVHAPDTIERVARSIEGIKGCARVRTRGLPEHAFLDMVILVAPEATVAHAHELADKLEARLAQEFPGLADIVIHIEPAAPVGEPADAARGKLT